MERAKEHSHFFIISPSILAQPYGNNMKRSTTALLAALIAFTAALPALNSNDHIRRANDIGHHIYVRCNTPPPSATGTAPSLSMATGTTPSIPISTSSSSCAVDGAVVCNGMEYFGLCNRGSVVWQRVAEGMGCVNGRVVGVGEYAAVPMAT